ncbi:MAG: class I SAM-dependent methyltransferase [Armatimonadota bacterium]|nr:class I SAM-dependent methyltransferase [Armatimonadota bacterium]
MFRYYAAAIVLKLLSSSRLGREFYRRVLGNVFGNRRRAKKGLHPSYIEHAKELLDCCRKYQAVEDGYHLLEIGTGWMHFYSLFLRLFFDVRVTMVDAWDNRQMLALKRYFADLEQVLDKRFSLSDEELARARATIGCIARACSFEELYESLGLEYVIDPTLSTLSDRSFDFVFSQGVLEHVRLEDLPTQIANMGRVLRPGGIQFHHIGIGDHLASYDRSASLKQYISYPEWIYKLLLNNQLQYINRVQKSEFHRMFTESGMEVLEERAFDCDISKLRPRGRFQGYSSEDLRCFAVTFVLRKPVHC